MVKLELTIDQVNLLLVALGKLPLEASVGLWAKIKGEAEKQMTVGVEEKKE
jgi:hypothetical protein